MAHVQSRQAGGTPAVPTARSPAREEVHHWDAETHGSPCLREDTTHVQIMDFLGMSFTIMEKA